MAVCCCSLAGTAACQHCSQNPFATDVWTNKTVTVANFDAKPTNADRIRAMTDEELAILMATAYATQRDLGASTATWLEFLKKESVFD